MPREKGELELSFQLKALVNPCLAEYRAYKTEQQHCTPCYLAGLALLMKFSCFHNAILHPLWGQIKGIKWMLQRCAWRKGLDNGIAFIFTAFFSAWCSRRSKLWEEQDHPSHIQPFLIANHQNRIPISRCTQHGKSSEIFKALIFCRSWYIFGTFYILNWPKLVQIEKLYFPAVLQKAKYFHKVFDSFWGRERKEAEEFDQIGK